MADNQTPEVRRKIMQSVRGKDTLPERTIRSHLHRLGFRFRKNVKKLPGTPDIVLPKYNTIVFVHGCFWHGHENCRDSDLPTTNIEFWNTKIVRNKERDVRVESTLKELGWKVVTVWQCQLKKKAFEDTMKRLIEQVTGS